MDSGDFSKDQIVAEIRRLANKNGKAPGRARFEKETGIREAHWLGEHWARWGDAVAEVGLAPNTLTTAIPDEVLLDRLSQLTEKIRHFPTDPEVRMPVGPIQTSRAPIPSSGSGADGRSWSAC